MFKLSNNLLSISDLVHERGFLAHLLEWFNFDEWAMESQALSLIAQLAQVCLHTPVNEFSLILLWRYLQLRKMMSLLITKNL